MHLQAGLPTGQLPLHIVERRMDEGYPTVGSVFKLIEYAVVENENGQNRMRAPKRLIQAGVVGEAKVAAEPEDADCCHDWLDEMR
jgi:hypothetical protein